MPGNKKDKKRARSDNSPQKGSPAEDIEAFREEMEHGTHHSITDLSKLILMSHDSLQETFGSMATALGNRVEAVECQVNDNRARIEILEQKMVELEAQAVRNNLILQNLELHKDAKDGWETSEQTQEQVREFLKKLEIDGDVTNFKCRRYRQTEEQKKFGPPICQVQLATTGHKGTIFQALKKKSREIKESVSNEIPASLKHEHKKLREKAAKIREDSGNKTRTKIMFIRNSLILKIKGETDKTFQEI